MARILSIDDQSVGGQLDMVETPYIKPSSPWIRSLYNPCIIPLCGVLTMAHVGFSWIVVKVGRIHDQFGGRHVKQSGGSGLQLHPQSLPLIERDSFLQQKASS